VLSAEEVPLDFVDTLIEFISVCNGPSAITPVVENGSFLYVTMK